MAEATKDDLVFVKTMSDLGGDIQVPIAFDLVKVQSIVDAAREFESEVDNLDTVVGVVGQTGVIEATGKDALRPTESTGITLKLINDWRLEFAGRGGPDFISCQVDGGNLIAENSFDNNPIKPSSFTQVQVRQSQSPTIINADVESFWDALMSDHSVIGSFGAQVKKLLTKIFFLGNT